MKSKMVKVLFVFGTRPEAIKLAPIIKELKRRKKNFQVVVCVTAQHREMLDQVLQIFSIRPEYDLDIMSRGQDLETITTNVVNRLRHVLLKEKPSLVIVQGDTTTAFAAGLSSFYQQIPVGHVEAGLRTYDKFQPFPEEINRHFLSVVSDYHFAPTEQARKCLLKENICGERIWVTGNSCVDALRWVKKNLSKPAKRHTMERYFIRKWSIDFSKWKRFILITGHRRENFGLGFKNICHALKKIASRHSDILLVYPVHLNPNVKKPVWDIIGRNVNNILLISPLEYEYFIFLMSRAYLILTDSGGIQEEAPSLGKPVLVMRNKTERPEGVRAGVVKLVGTDPDRIYRETNRLLNSKTEYCRMARKKNPYGDGKTSKRIAKILHRLYQKTHMIH